MDADQLENLSDYEINTMVACNGEILCSVDEDSLPQSVKSKIKKARNSEKAKAEKERLIAARKEERSKEKEIEKAKKLLAEAGVIMKLE